MLAIIADDLTGAIDSAAPFAGRGLHTEIALDVDGVPGALREKPAVLSVNLGSRELTANEAQAATMAVLSLLPANTTLFKKIDSRLKGHIAAELDVMPFSLALVSPAIPEFGRIVKSGSLEGFGIEAPIMVASKLGDHASRAMILDVTSQDEMNDALKAGQRAGADLLIGARGLAEALAEQISGKADLRPAEIPAGPALFVIGSRDPITIAQVDELRHSCPVHYIPAPNGHIVSSALDANGVTIMQAIAGEEPCTPPDVSNHLATSIHPALTAGVALLLLSGGATAEAVLLKMGIRRFRLVGECLPGLGLAYANGHCIIAKSGGFGHPGTLRDVANTILRKMG
ncbi:hypothetical protein GCM10011491_37690 [Brucella endophytica]|uniref:Four-carbon acid sugar kinase family protein n=1 Tax=Brucella endophytica TaxID=1963359 RepID=A0A916SP17_9HYPH|nr:four-carbon acid sugar kinase family protein [Brucella endophytica]GGB06040.1 hypothetical protein GCM10011491_37690 [Brucella endophytica]